MKENGLLKKHHFYLLLSIYSKIVDFSHCDIDINLIIQLIQERCYMLQQLNFSHCVKLPKASFNTLLSHCGKGLTKLELSHSNIANDVLSTISVYCSELSYLDISKTNSISDPGLLCLAHEQDLDAKANSRFGKCLKLVVLKLNGCEKISEQAVASVIVNLPKLRVLEYQDSISAIALARNHKVDLKVTLTSLHSSAELIDETDVCEVLLANCKSLQSLNLTTFMELSEATAFSILEIDNLKEFSLVNEFGSNAVSFQLTFSPILTKLGPNLTHLTLSQVCDISVGNIRQHCTKLETLSLIWNTHYIDDNSQDQMYPYFQCLKNVKVFSTDSDSNGMDDGFSNVSYLDILSIISSPKLEEIHMLSCQNFIGRFIEVIECLFVRQVFKNGFITYVLIRYRFCSIVLWPFLFFTVQFKPGSLRTLFIKPLGE